MVLTKSSIKAVRVIMCSSIVRYCVTLVMSKLAF